MSRRIISWLMKCYPASWRSEYGPELEDLISREPLRVAAVWNVLWNALREHSRQPAVRLFLLALMWGGAAFLTGVAFARPLWKVLSAPVLEVLIEQGVTPPALVSNQPWEQFEVVWFGIPLLVAAFATYACALFGVWRLFPERRLFIAFAMCLFLVSGVSSFAAWQHGSFMRLDIDSHHMVSVSHCFMLLAASTLGTTALLQLPLAAFFGWRIRQR